MENSSIKPWWEYVNLTNPRHSGTDFIDAVANAGLTAQALVNNRVLVCKNTNGATTLSADKEAELYKSLINLGGRIIIQYDNTAYFNWPDAIVQVNNNPAYSYYYLCSTNQKLGIELSALLKRLFVKETKPSSRVYVLLPSHGGLVISPIGRAGVSLERGNYMDDVLTKYDLLVKDMGLPNPLGRLAIMNGIPGTGKTYLIRALIDELQDLKFVLLSSNMVADLSGPSLLQALKNASEEDIDEGELIKVPLVLIIEDADNCLVPRGTDNISDISTILNMSDGIIGNMLDLRIICTTNATVKKIDPAITRPGRLSQQIEVGLLDKEHAHSVYNRLGGTNAEEQLPTYKYSLSEVYAIAKGNNQVLANTKQNDIGFFTSGSSSKPSAGKYGERTIAIDGPPKIKVGGTLGFD